MITTHMHFNEQHSKQSKNKHNVEVEEAIGEVKMPRLHSCSEV